MKLALLALDKECPEFGMALQIHDEVCGSIPDRKTAKKVSEIMVNVVKARVPFRCDAEVGRSWGELSLLCMEKDCLQPVCASDKFACEDHKIT